MRRWPAAGCRALGQIFGASPQRIHNGWNGPEKGDQTRSRHRACAHRPNIGAIDIVRRHVCDGHGSGKNSGSGMAAEELDGGHHHQPGESAASKDHSGNARPNDVAHAEIFRSRVGAD